MPGPEQIIPFLVLSIPIVAIAGGIVAGIVRSTGQQRMVELAQRERIAAIEKGIDPDKLPSFPQMAQELGSAGLSPSESAKRRAQNLMIAGLVTTFGGAGMLFFLRILARHDEVWSVAIVPIMVGVALLLSAFLVWPRNGVTPPRA